MRLSSEHHTYQVCSQYVHYTTVGVQCQHSTREQTRKEKLQTPQCHKDGEEDRGSVVEQVAGPGRAAGSGQFPVSAHSVTHRAHGYVVFFVANLHAVNAKKQNRISGHLFMYHRHHSQCFPKSS